MSLDLRELLIRHRATRDVIAADRLWHTTIIPLYDGGFKDEIISLILELGQTDEKPQKPVRSTPTFPRGRESIYRGGTVRRGRPTISV